jgi:hypothetical protein
MWSKPVLKIAIAVLTFGILLSACAGQTVQAELPAAPATPTAVAVAQPTSSSSAANGAQVLIEVPDTPPAHEMDIRTRAAGLGMELLGWSVQREGDSVFAVAHVCAQLPGLDWHIGRASLHTQVGILTMTAFSAVKFEKRQDAVWRCDRLYFPWPAKTPSLTHLRLEVSSVEEDVPESPDCRALNEKLQAQGIEVKPVAQEGVGGCEVVRKPRGMSEEEAYARVQQALTHAVEGPWVMESPGEVLALESTRH